MFHGYLVDGMDRIAHCAPTFAPTSLKRLVAVINNGLQAGCRLDAEQRSRFALMQSTIRFTYFRMTAPSPNQSLESGTKVIDRKWHKNGPPSGPLSLVQ